MADWARLTNTTIQRYVRSQEDRMVESGKFMLRMIRNGWLTEGFMPWFVISQRTNRPSRRAYGKSKALIRNASELTTGDIEFLLADLDLLWRLVSPWKRRDKLDKAYRQYKARRDKRPAQTKIVYNTDRLQEPPAA